MKKSSLAKGLAYSLPLALAVPSVANAQEPARQNRIYSSNLGMSAAGNSILLTNKVYNLTLNPNSKLSLDYNLRLSSDEGNVSYDVTEIRDGLLNIMEYSARNDSSERGKAFRVYLQDLLEKTPANDPASIEVLRKSLEDNVIEGSELITAGAPLVEPGKYLFIARSKSREGLKGQSVPLIVDVQYEGVNPVTVEEIQTPPTQIIPPAPAQGDTSKVETRYEIEPIISRFRRIQETGRTEQRRTGERSSEGRDEEGSKSGLGLSWEFGIGSNGTMSDGLSLGIPLSEKLTAELAANYFINRGQPIRDYSTTITNTRVRKPIGLATEEERIDQTTRNYNGELVASLLAGGSLDLGNGIELFGGVGPALLRHADQETMESTVNIIRNGSTINSGTLENSRPVKPYLDWAWASSIVARFNLNKDGKWSVGFSRDRVANRNYFGLNVRKKIR